jgi:hypothetical protein
VTQQRIPLFLFSALLAAAGCGGGPGARVEVDSDAPPDIADQQPRISDQAPVISGALPPTANPPGSPPPGGGGGGGSCIDMCNRIEDRGCAPPEGGCEAGCDPNFGELCASEAVAFAVCALPIACPEEFDDLSEQERLQAINLCPSQYAALLACIQQD